MTLFVTALGIVASVISIHGFITTDEVGWRLIWAVLSVMNVMSVIANIQRLIN